MQAFTGLRGDEKKEEKGGERGQSQREEGATASGQKITVVWSGAASKEPEMFFLSFLHGEAEKWCSYIERVF